MAGLDAGLWILYGIRNSFSSFKPYKRDLNKLMRFPGKTDEHLLFPASSIQYPASLPLK